jgi:hypothetical protein
LVTNCNVPFFAIKKVMETKGIGAFNLEEAYKKFVKDSIRYNKKQLTHITPDYMGEQYYYRKNIICAVDELCSTFSENMAFILNILNSGMRLNSVNAEIQEKNIEILLNLVLNFTVLINHKEDIGKWILELKETEETLDKMDTRNLEAEDILDSDSKLLKKISKMLKK